MSIQEAVKRIVAMGFEEVAASFNQENQTTWAFVFVGSDLPSCFCEDEEAVFDLFVFLKHLLCLEEREKEGEVFG